MALPSKWLSLRPLSMALFRTPLLSGAPLDVCVQCFIMAGVRARRAHWHVSPPLFSPAPAAAVVASGSLRTAVRTQELGLPELRRQLDALEGGQDTCTRVERIAVFSDHAQAKVNELEVANAELEDEKRVLDLRIAGEDIPNMLMNRTHAVKRWNDARYKWNGTPRDGRSDQELRSFVAHKLDEVMVKLRSTSLLARTASSSEAALWCAVAIAVVRMFQGRMLRLRAAVLPTMSLPELQTVLCSDNLGFCLDCLRPHHRQRSCPFCEILGMG